MVCLIVFAAYGLTECTSLVALSRAREGMYVLGNARDLRTRSSMWGKVLSRLEQDDCVGPALPVVCHRHQEAIEWISKPGQLGRVAPDGKLITCLFTSMT